jgi:octaprenyl-diphosphate synthase
MRTNTATVATVPRGLALPPDALLVIERDRLAVERTLAQLLGTPETRIDEAASRELLAGGKRLRPLLTCVVMRVLGRDPLPHLRHVVPVELAHTGSLLHDDIIDEATTRRGLEAAHLAFDVPTAVLAGDNLVVLALEQLARGAPPELLGALCGAIRELCAGESLERERRFDDSVELDHCRRVSRLKTASLFGYAARAGAILAGAAESVGRAAEAFGVGLGLAFQTTDDLLDFRGDPSALGKPIGRDLELGMVTVPLAIALERDRSLRRLVRSFWRDGKQAGRTLERIHERMARVGAFAETRRLAAEDAARAMAALGSLPSSRWRDHLREIARNLLQRAA